MQKTFATVLIGLAALVAATPSSAGVIATHHVSVIASPPVFVDSAKRPQSNQNNTYLFFEGTYTLGSALALDAHGTGAFDSLGVLNGGSIAAGTTVSSYMLFSNPKRGVQTYTGWVKFDSPIYGVIVLNDSLDASDPLVGHVGTTYMQGRARGLEFATDSFRINVNGNKLWFNFKTSTRVDSIRILTSPEPATFVMSATAMLGGIGFSVLRRRSRIS